MPDVRVRFAPSPSGMLHLGSARTALFNWAFARRHGGRFLLRIEDTDRERSTQAFEDALFDGLRWLGLDWDEEPVRQSERGARHAAVVESLLERGRAYRCDCTREELEERREATIARGEKWTYDGRCRERALGPDCGPHTVRLRLPESGRLGFQDAVIGPSGQDASEIGDRIIRRSDGSPLYHLAVVVDDLDMGITHVLRGLDHHPNTPLQVALYRALDAEPPCFAHLPLLVGAGGKKLSKRREDVAVEAFREAGYLPEAMLNWLVRLGWSHGDQELFTPQEIPHLFDLDGVNRSSAQVDAAKLAALNQHHLRALPPAELRARAAPFLAAVAGGPVEDSPALDRLLELLKERSTTLADLAERARFFLCRQIEIGEKAAAKHLTAAARPLLADLREELSTLSDWTEGPLEKAFESVRTRHDVGMGKLAQPVRVAVTGSAASPGIFETLAVLGQPRTLERLDAALSRLPD